jgi:hypothetical protein
VRRRREEADLTGVPVMATGGLVSDGSGRAPMHKEEVRNSLSLYEGNGMGRQHSSPSEGSSGCAAMMWSNSSR